jgi:hypothetical protein
MSATACILAVLLAFEAATPAATSAECPLTDNQCKARLYERRAAAAATPGQRALYLHSAYRSYLFLFDKTGDVRDLCAARRSFDASLAVDDQPEPQRAKFEAGRDELTARERQSNASCGSVARRRARKPDPPLVARGLDPAPQPRTKPVAGPVEPAPRDTSTPALAAVDRLMTAELRSPSETDLPPLLTPPPRSDDALMPVKAGRVKLMPAVDSSRPGRAGVPHPGRGLVIAGGATLGVGVVLTALLGSRGSRMSATRRELVALDDRIDAYASPEQDAKDEALRREFHAMQPTVITLAVASGATLIIAAILASVGGRRMARAASRTALAPAPGGLVFHGRF